MKKIPTLFVREFEGHRITKVLNEVTPGCLGAFEHGIATVKYDGSCCAIIEGELYKRYDAKAGKNPPEGAIPCCNPDPVTGHWPHWVKVDPDKPEDKWFWVAYNNSLFWIMDGSDGTYEAVGPHFQGNPHNLKSDMLIKHGERVVEVGRTYDDIKQWLKDNYEEGLVFWLNGEPVCKIKRTDFGMVWNNK